MKKKQENRGFAMLEVMVIMMLVMMMISVIYMLTGMEYRQVYGRVQEEEAYYAAVSAVRMMEQAVLSGECEEGSAADVLIEGDGMSRMRTKLVFDDENLVEIPVTIWSERDGEELLLAAEATCGKKTKVVTLRLVKSARWSEEIATASNGSRGETEKWIPAAYEVR